LKPPPGGKEIVSRIRVALIAQRRQKVASFLASLLIFFLPDMRHRQQSMRHKEPAGFVRQKRPPLVGQTDTPTGVYSCGVRDISHTRNVGTEVRGVCLIW